MDEAPQVVLPAAEKFKRGADFVGERTALATLRVFVPLIVILFGVCKSAAAQSSIVLPPGPVLTGPIYYPAGSKLYGQIFGPVATGAEANGLILSTPPTLSFVPNLPAAVVLTGAPTTYARVYTQGTTRAAGGFIAPSNVIRGLSSAEIKNALALPYLPDHVTIVQVPTGTCVLTASGAAVTNTNPSNGPVGFWGNGGTLQSYLVGSSGSPNCAGAQFLAAAAYTDQQALGAAALAYGPHAGAGNTAAVAYALDHANPFPVQFSDMDGIYSALDQLNYDGPAQLQRALTQLDGEIYADLSTAVITAVQVFLNTLRDELHRPLVTTEKWLPWFSAFGGAGGLTGDGNSNNLNIGLGGAALGADYGIDPVLRVGLAVAYARGGFATTNGGSGSGSYDTFSFAPYARYQPSAAYLEGVLGYAYTDGDVSRNIIFPEVARTSSSSPKGNAFLSRVEAGYQFTATVDTMVTPFAAMESIVFFQKAISESGAGAVDLSVASRTTGSAQSTLGIEVKHAFAVGLSAPLEVTGRVGWAHDYLPTSRTITAFMTGAPGANFTVDGTPAPRNTAVFALGASLRTGTVNFFLQYAGIRGGGVLIQGGTAGIQLSF